MLANVPRVVYTLETFTLTFPQAPWSPISAGVGGSRRAGSGGILAAYQVRADEFVEMTFRMVNAAEEDKVRRWLRWMQQTGGTATVYPDVLRAPTTSIVVDLETPKMGEDVRALPDQGYPQAWRITFRVRITNGVRFSRDYYV